MTTYQPLDPQHGETSEAKRPTDAPVPATDTLLPLVDDSHLNSNSIRPGHGPIAVTPSRQRETPRAVTSWWICYAEGFPDSPGWLYKLTVVAILIGVLVALIVHWQFGVLALLALCPALALFCCCYTFEPQQRITAKISRVVTNFLCGILGALPVAGLEVFLLWLYKSMYPVNDTDINLDGNPGRPAEPNNPVVNVWLAALVVSFVVAALCEESFKYLLVKVVSGDIDNPHGIVVLALAGALGFATLENLLYVFAGGLGAALTRAAVSVPMHGLTGCIIGAYIARDRFVRFDKTPHSYCQIIRYPVLIHGLFDMTLIVLVLSGKQNDMRYMWIPMVVCPAMVLTSYLIYRSLRNAYATQHEVYVRHKLGLAQPGEEEEHQRLLGVYYESHRNSGGNTGNGSGNGNGNAELNGTGDGGAFSSAPSQLQQRTHAHAHASASADSAVLSSSVSHADSSSSTDRPYDSSQYPGAG